METNKKQGFIFGGDTGTSYEQLQKRRAVAQALMANNASRAPRNVGEGLHSFGNAIAAALINKRADKRQGELDAQWSETAGGLGLDPGRLALVKNLPYNQRNSYLLSHMDRQDALKRSGGGGGQGKAALQALMVSQLMGEDGGNSPTAPSADPQASPSQSNFFNGNGSVGGVGSFGSLPRPQAPPQGAPVASAQPMESPNQPMGPQLAAMGAQPSVSPVVSTSGTFDDSRSYQTASNGPLSEDYAGLNVSPSLAGQQPPQQQPPALGESGYKSALPVGLEQAMQGVAGETRPELGFNIQLSQQPVAQEAPPVDIRGQITGEINALYGKLSETTDPNMHKAIKSAIGMKSDQLDLLPKEKAETSDQYFGTIIPVVNDDGTKGYYQLKKSGGAEQIELPPGTQIDPDVEFRDLGTHFQAFDSLGKPTGGQISKNLAATAGEKKAGEQAINMAGEAWTAAGKIRVSQGTIKTAIGAIDSGAKAGALQKYLPNITEESATLKNSMDRMGLDVIGAVTFGALSKGELELAMQTAVPRDLAPPELRAWLVKKQAANDKAIAMLENAAQFLGQPETTLADWIARNKRQTPPPTVAGSGAAPGGVATHKFNPSTGKIEEVSQ